MLQIKGLGFNFNYMGFSFTQSTKGIELPVDIFKEKKSLDMQ